MTDLKHIMLEVHDLSAKIKLGLAVIQKARAEGKDVSQWEKSVETLQKELASLLQDISKLKS